MNTDPDPYRCLRVTSISIGIYNIVYCLIQFGILGWQVQAVKILQWEYENREIPSTALTYGGFSARFPGLYALYSETPERRRINAMYVIVLICLGLSIIHLITTVSLLFGVVKRQPNWMIPWFFTCAPLTIMCTAYAILWWSGDIFNEQLTMSITEFVLSLGVNGVAFIVVLMYFLRITGRLSSEKPRLMRELPSRADIIAMNSARRSGRSSAMGRGRRPVAPTYIGGPSRPESRGGGGGGMCGEMGELPPWRPPMPDQPPYNLERKLRRRERDRARSPTAILRQDYLNAGSMAVRRRPPLPLPGEQFSPSRIFAPLQRRSHSVDHLPLGATAQTLQQPTRRVTPQSTAIDYTTVGGGGPSDSREWLVAQPQPQRPATAADTRRSRQSTSTSRSRDARSHQRREPTPRKQQQQTSSRSSRRGRDGGGGGGFSSMFRRKSPQRVSFNSRPKVYQRTPESSLSSNGNNPQQQQQITHSIV